MEKEIKLFEEVNKELRTNYKSNEDINWDEISRSQLLSESFIEKFQDKVDWESISAYQILSESFIEKHKNDVEWTLISVSQKLSENFIEKYETYLDWENISAYQILSESFMEKYQKYLDWDCIASYQKLSKEFIEKHKDKIDFEALNGNLLYQTNIGKDWFIAYISKVNNDISNEDNLLALTRLCLTYNSHRVKIYYKDLINTFIVPKNKVTVLRECTTFKVKGRK